MDIRKESLRLAFIVGLSILPSLTCAQSIMNILKEDQETSSFARALEDTGLDQQLEEIGPFTVFAPSNEAFDDFSNGLNSGSERMKSVLLNHIMTGLATERSIRAMTKATSLGGLTLNIRTNGEEVYVNRSRLILSNKRAGNGVIHIVDRVLR